MSWLRRLLGRRTDNTPLTSATRRPLYIPYDAPKSTPPAAEDSAQQSAELELQEGREAPPKQADSQFDPYNTGAFNRSRSWDSISKQKGR